MGYFHKCYISVYLFTGGEACFSPHSSATLPRSERSPEKWFGGGEASSVKLILSNSPPPHSDIFPIGPSGHGSSCLPPHFFPLPPPRHTSNNPALGSCLLHIHTWCFWILSGTSFFASPSIFLPYTILSTLCKLLSLLPFAEMSPPLQNPESHCCHSLVQISVITNLTKLQPFALDFSLHH